ncbi:peptidyl-tRNA hydrolase protein 1 [Boothiomyces sp. JEL0866]|nr:peptidyl-tRNA hydrolase protein 1 [Boothiomyces sp. JEL0866]
MIFVGLGNHTLTATRHNMGWIALDYSVNLLLGPNAWILNKNMGGWVAEGIVRGIDVGDKGNWEKRVVFFKPKEYMNRNGIQIAKALRNYSFNHSQLILVHDDLEKKLGKVTVKEKGSANGHNGIKSVMSVLNTSEFQRIRIGIDRPVDKDQVDTYVLSGFSPHEHQTIESTVFPTFHKSLIQLIKKRALEDTLS